MYERMYAVDWGKAGKFYYAFFANGIFEVQEWKDGMLAFVLAHPGSTILVEESFESYDPIKRNAVIDAAAATGTTLVTVPTNLTANRRKDWDVATARDAQGGKKAGVSDAEDARVLLRILIEAKTLFRVPKKWVPAPARDWRQQIVRARRAGYADTNVYVKKWLPYLALAKRLAPEEATALGKREMVLPLIALFLNASSRADVDNYFCGYRKRGIVSSNFYHHRLPALCGGRKSGGIKNPATRKAAMKTYVKAVRHLYGLVQKQRRAELEAAA